MYMHVLFTYLYVVYVPPAWLVPKEVKRECQIPLELELAMVISCHWLLGTHPGPLQEQQVLLITEPSL